MTTKVLSVFLTVLMLFTTISVGIIVPEADAATAGETITVTTIAQLNNAIGTANTAGVDKITTIKLGGNINYTGSLAAFTTLSTANVVFDFNGYSLIMDYKVEEGRDSSGRSDIQLPSENANKSLNGIDTFTTGMIVVKAGSTLQIINTKPGNISTMQVYTDFNDTSRGEYNWTTEKQMDNKTSASLIYCEGTLIIGSTDTGLNEFTLYAHSSCRNTYNNNVALYYRKSATVNCSTVTLNSSSAILKMYGGNVNATGVARASRGTYTDVLCYALNVNNCYSAEIYGGSVNIPKCPVDNNNGISQASDKASEGATARISAIRCASPYLYIFDVDCAVQTQCGKDSSKDNDLYTSCIWTTEDANAPYVYGGNFSYSAYRGDNSSTAENYGYVVRGAYKLASAGTLTPSAVSGSNYGETNPDTGETGTGSVATYTVFIGDNGVVKDGSNNIVRTDMPAENGIDMFSYDTFRQYLSQYKTTLDVYCGNSVITTNGDVNGEVGSTNYLLNAYKQVGWAGKTHPGAAYDLNFVTPEKATITGGGSLFLAPVWEENEYTITYDWNDDDSSVKVSNTTGCPTVYKVTSSGALGTPVRPGYRFVNWTLKAVSYRATDTKQRGWDTGSTYPAGFPLENRYGDIELQANWEQLTYEATFDLNGGNIGGDTSDRKVTFHVTDRLTVPSNVQKDYYNFDGTFTVDYVPDPSESSWQKGTSYESGTTIDTGNYGNVTFKADFTPVQYTVTYDSNGGTSVEDPSGAVFTYNIESTHTLPSVTRQGYKFVGWLPEPAQDSNWVTTKKYTPGESFEGMHGNVTLIAQWESSTYTLKLELDATESIPGGITEYNYAYSQTLTLNNPVKTGYVFTGWRVVSAPDAGTNWVDANGVGEYKEDIATGKVTIPANKIGDVTLEPMWTPDTYTLSYNPNGGNGVPAVEYGIEDSITLPSTTKKGYTFTGWSVFSNEGNWIKEIYYAGEAVTGMYGDVTLVANWDKTNYVITLNANGGTVSPEALNYNFESEVALPVPSRTGYSFDGWRVSYVADGASWETDKVYTDALPQGQYGNMTLEAQWVHTQYTIHFTGQGTLPSDMKYYIDSPVFNLSGATNAGYSFTYWTVTAPAGNWEINEKIYPDTDITGKYGNVTLNANYEAVSYSIVYRDIDGTETSETYDMTVPVEIKDYTKDGYTFSGWTVEYVTAGEGSGWPSEIKAGTYGAGERYGSVILTPILTASEYSISFIPDGGTPLANLPYTVESTDNLPVPERTGYDFAGWMVTSAAGNWNDGEIISGNTAVTGRYGNVILTAQWTPKAYTITWVTGSGTYTTQADYDTVPDYSTVDTSKAPDAQYTYTFTGWSPAVTTVKGEATYTAQYSRVVNNYTVTWVYETDESGTAKTESAAYAYGTHPVFNNGINPTKTSSSGKYYRFVGWYDENGNLLGADTFVTGNVTYTARYNEIEAPRTVTWIIDGISTETMWAVGETPEYVGTPIKPDADGMKYTFSGWTPAIVEVQADTDYTYTAQFTQTPQTYTAQFDLNGGSCGSSTEVTYNKSSGLNMPVPVKDGYSFAGWRVTANGGTWTQTDLLTFSNYTGLWGDVSFIAEYTVAEYIIKVEADDGTTPEYKYTIESTDTLPELAKDGYVLSGWMIVSADGNWTAGDTVAADKPLTGMFGNVTIHPIWTARLYKISWVSGDITQTAEFSYGQTVVVYPPVAKAGYTAQWDNTVPAIMPAEDLTFTAVYTPIQYYLRFNSAGGSAVENFYYNITASGELPVPTREGASFIGWRVSASDGSWIKNKVYDADTLLAGQYGNATFTAVWEIEIHTVTWVAGDVTKVTKWYHGAIPSYDGVPYKSADDYNSYIFSGWDKEIKTVTEDVVYTAIFTEIERLYTVKWVVDGFVKEEKLYKYNELPVYTGPAPSRASTSEFDFTFAGWSPEMDKVTADITYIAMFDTITKLLGLRIDKSAVFLKAGEEAVLSAIISPATATSKDVNWISADESVATVDINGKVTAVGSGETLIRVESKDGQFKSYCFASVSPVISQYLVVSAGYVSTTRLPGEAIQLNARVMPENTTAKNIVWTSSDISVAKVDSNGLVVFGEVAGTAIITASCDGYASGSIEVTTTLKTSDLEDSAKTYVIMFNKSTSAYIINGVAYESVTVFVNEGDTLEFLLAEPHFVTLNGIQMSRDTDGVFRIKNIKDNYTVISTERADIGFEEDFEENNAGKPSFFDRLKAFFKSIIDFFRNLFA